VKSGKGIEAWASHVPPQWKITPLRHCVTFAEGPGILAVDFVNEGVPLIRIAGLGNRKATLEGCDFLASELVERKWVHLRVQPGDLLISGSASSGLCCEVDEVAAGAVPYTGIFIVRPRGEAVERDFARWFFLSVEFLAQAERARTGSAIQHFGPSHLSGMWIALPPAREQRAISSYLDVETTRLDALVAEKERVLNLLAEKRRALIAHAVTRGLDPLVKWRDSGVPWLGAIPVHWGTERARWLFRERDERSESGEEELLTVSHLTGVTPRSEKDVTMFEADTTQGYKVCRPGDLVINTLWAWMGAMGVAPINGIASPAYNVYEPGPLLLPAFVDALVRIPQYAQEVTRYSKGVWSSRLRLYPEGFFEVLFPVPPIGEQEAIVAYIASEVAKLERLSAATARTIDLLKERRTALIAGAVTGRIDVQGRDGKTDNDEVVVA
jgi:type I restriction enzyme, S subunit